MLTGWYPHTDGLRSVSAENHLRRGTPELVCELARAGFQTAVIGINHVWEEGSFYGEGDRVNQPGAGAVETTSFSEGIGHFAKVAVDFPAGMRRSVSEALRRVEYGGLLTGLRELGLEEQTLLVFTSDHGDYAGQYGLVEKWDTDLRDCLLHVPFLSSGPGIPRGEMRDGLSEHTDLAVTLVELLGVTPRPEWNRHGRSLVPIISGGSGKEAVFACGGHEIGLRRRFAEVALAMKGTGRLSDKQRTYFECPDAMARAKMVRTRDGKYVVRETGDDELYHVAENRWELNNVFGKAGYEPILLNLQRHLVGWSLLTDPDEPYLHNFGA